MTSQSSRPVHDDDALIGIIQRDGDSQAGRAATNELLGRYHRNVYLWCFRYVRDHDRAMDLSQDVMINVLRGLPRFESRSSFSTWLFTITQNRCRSAVRRKEPIIDAEIDMELFKDSQTDPAGLVEEAEAEAKVMALISETLDPLEQQAIWLRCIEKMPVDEITEVLNIDASTGARSILQRARRKLRAARGLTNTEGDES
jgi:RNA polymerase sigma-70 factor (ECF subfamily)